MITIKSSCFKDKIFHCYC